MKTITLSALCTILLSTAAIADEPKPSKLDPIRSAFKEGRNEAVVMLADRALFELAGKSPKLRGEIYFWKGAALQRQGRHQEALVALDSAMELGCKFSELHFVRAQALRAVGQDEEAEQSFQEAEKLLQEDPDGLERLRKRWWEGTDEDKKFRLNIQPVIGYDSNIVSVNDDALLLEDVGQESFFYGFVLSARYLLVDEKRMSFLLEYENNLRAFTSEPDLSYSENVISAEWITQVGEIDWLRFDLREALGKIDSAVRRGDFQSLGG